MALGIAFLGLATLEYSWRSMGFRPGVTDSATLWALQRGRVYQRNEGDSVLVLVGGSAIQTDLSIPTLEESLPGFRVVQLGIHGSNPTPVLRDLAEDDEFAGTVILSLWDVAILSTWGSAAAYVDHYQAGPEINELLNESINSAIQNRFVVRLAELNLASHVHRYARGAELVPDFNLMTARRGRLGNYDVRPNMAEHRTRRIAEARERNLEWTRSPRMRGKWAESLAEIAGMIGAIVGRGGRVATVHFPVGEAMWPFHEMEFPREVFWSQVEAALPHPVIHFMDYPSMRSFDVPDDSHLDQKSIDEFTEVLVAILHEEGFF